MVLGTRVEFRKWLICCHGDFDKLLIRFKVNLVSFLIVLEFPFSFSMNLILPMMLEWKIGDFREL